MSKRKNGKKTAEELIETIHQNGGRITAGCEVTDVEAQAEQAEADVQQTINEMEAQSTEVPPEQTKEEKAKKEKKSQMEITRANILKRINELTEKFGFRPESKREQDVAAGVVYNVIYLLDQEWQRIMDLPEDEKGFVKFAMGFRMNVLDVEVETKCAFTQRREAKTKFKGEDPNQQLLPFDKPKDTKSESEPEPEIEEALNFNGEPNSEPADFNPVLV